MKPIRWMAIASLAAGTVVVSSCTAERPAHEELCISWMDVSDPQVAYDEADAVVLGRSSATGTTAPMHGIQATVHEVEVEQVYKGDLTPGTVRVASTPTSCTAKGGYPDGDPLETEGEVIVFLRTPGSGDVWSLITPSDAVLPAPEGGTLPFETDG